jgi:hypothetical protein
VLEKSDERRFIQTTPASHINYRLRIYYYGAAGLLGIYSVLLAILYHDYNGDRDVGDRSNIPILSERTRIDKTKLGKFVQIDRPTDLGCCCPNVNLPRSPMISAG